MIRLDRIDARIAQIQLAEDYCMVPVEYFLRFDLRLMQKFLLNLRQPLLNMLSHIPIVLSKSFHLLTPDRIEQSMDFVVHDLMLRTTAHIKLETSSLKIPNSGLKLFSEGPSRLLHQLNCVLDHWHASHGHTIRSHMPPVVRHVR